MNLAFKYLLKSRSNWCSKDQSSQQTTFSTYTTSEEHMHIWESEAQTSCLWDNRKVPKLAGLHRTFPASIQQSWSTGVKTRGQNSFRTFIQRAIMGFSGSWPLVSGADPGFLLGGGALVSCSTSAPINHILFFLQNTSCIRKPQVISWGGGGGGVGTPCTLPLDPPLSLGSKKSVFFLPLKALLLCLREFER